ncbi:MAG TPA: PrsW family glutamic-type intramembrane protease [Chroococcidiopsis sp.]
MNIWVIVTLAVSPGLFLLWFFYKKDKLEPEPKHLILKTFFLGVLLAIPVLIVQLPFTLFLPEILLYILVAPITEEYGKYLVVRLGIYKHAEFDEPVDGIIYGVAAALGFATIENVGYLLSTYYAAVEADENARVAVLTLFVVRGLLSVPGHALWSSLWGYSLGVAKFSPPERSAGLVRNGLLLAMVSHGLFNGLLVIFPPAAIGVLVLIPIGWRMTFRRIAAALAVSPHAHSSLRDRQEP